jgi:hypothetical protein
MKTLSNKALLFATLSACTLLSGQTFAEGVAIPGANLIAYHGADKSTSGQVVAKSVAMPSANLIAYHGAENTSGTSAKATGSFCSITSAKNFSAGAIGLLSARSSC